MKQFLMLMLLTCGVGYSQTITIGGSLAGMLASGGTYNGVPGTETPPTFFPTDANRVAISCPAMVLPGGGFYGSTTNNYTMTGGSLVATLPGSTNWTIPTPQMPCLLILDGVPPGLLNTWYLYASPAMAGSRVSWGQVLSRIGGDPGR